MNLLLALLVIALIPLVLIYMLAMLEPFAFVRWRMVGVSLAWGGVSFLIAWVIQSSQSDGSATAALTIALLSAPVREEALKMIFPVLIYERTWARYSGDGLVYGFAVGCGFAILESVSFAVAQPDNALGIVLTRTVSTGLFHASMAAIAGAAVCGVMYYRRRLAYPFFGIILAFAVIAHHWFNLGAFVEMILDEFLDYGSGEFILYALLLLAIVFGLMALIRWREWQRIPREAADVLSPMERAAVQHGGALHRALGRQSKELGPEATRQLGDYLTAEAQIALLAHRARAGRGKRRNKGQLWQQVLDRRVQAGQLLERMAPAARAWLDAQPRLD